MAKISHYPDGGAKQDADQFVIVRAGVNRSILGSNIGGAGAGGDFVSTLTAAEIAITGAGNLTISRMHVCSGTTADYTVTLPAVAGNTGKLVGIRGSTALTKIVTIDGNGAEKVDNQDTILLLAGMSYVFLCDGIGWFVVSNRSVIRAWVNFDGTGTPAIVAAYNVSSITDNGTGDWTVNFTVAFPSANYSWAGLPFDSTGFAGFLSHGGAGGTMTATTHRFIAAKRVDGTNYDPDKIIIIYAGG